MRSMDTIADDVAIEARGGQPLPAIIAGNTFMDDESVVEPEQLIEGVLHRGAQLIIGGGSKGRKTWSFMDLAMCVSEGIPWWGWNTYRGKVLYLNFELQAFAMQKRMKYIKDYYNSDKTKYQVSGENFDVWNLRGHAADIDMLRDRIGDQLNGYSLVVFDPLYKMLGGRNENDAGDMGSLMNQLEQMAVNAGCSVVSGAHYRKGGPGEGKSSERMSGSGVLQRNPDAIITMSDLDEQVLPKEDKEGEEGKEYECCVIEPILRNFQPYMPFGVYWDFPIFKKGDWINIQKVKGGGAATKKFFVEDIKGKFKDRGWMTYKETYEAIMEEVGCKDRKAKDIIAEALACKLLVKSELENDERGRPKYTQI